MEVNDSAPFEICMKILNCAVNHSDNWPTTWRTVIIVQSTNKKKQVQIDIKRTSVVQNN